jgi:hypothetical protein
MSIVTGNSIVNSEKDSLWGVFSNSSLSSFFFISSILLSMLFIATRYNPNLLSSARIVLSFCGCLRRSALVALSAAADASTTATARAAASLTVGVASSTSKPAAEADESGPSSTFIGFSSQLVGLGQEKSLLTIAEVKTLSSHLPSRCVGRDWLLCFSTARDGYSLSTLFACVRGKGPTMIVIMDDDQRVFGGFASKDWSSNDMLGAFGLSGFGISQSFAATKFSTFASHGESSNTISSTTSSSSMTPSKQSNNHGHGSYFGSGECFLFSTRPSMGVFRWTRKDNMFMLARKEALAFGGGGKFGIWLDSNLERGMSGSSETFGNPQFSSNEIFKIVSVQVYCFVLGGRR